jgi:hypothetical protein
VHFKLTKVLTGWLRHNTGELAALSRGESVVFCSLADAGEPAGDEYKSDNCGFFGAMARGDPLVL